MAENKDKKPQETPAARVERERRERASVDEARERQERIQQHASAASRGDLPPGRTLVGGIPVEPQPEGGAEDFVAEAAGGMIEQQNRMMAGQAVTPALTPEQEEHQRKAAEERAEKSEARLQGDPLVALHRALAEQQVAVPLTTDDLFAPEPGQTERGWDPEVTARHPKFLAAMIEELYGEGAAKSGPLGARGSKKDSREHFIDPTDSVALAAAQRDLAFHESRKAGIIQHAIRVGTDRLAAAQAAAGAGDYSQAEAARDVLESLRDQGRAAGHEM